MIEQTLTAEEQVAAARLRAVWFPNRIVLRATSHWIAEANDQQQIDHAFRALRWCKWQWLKCLYNPKEQTLFDEQFRQYYRLLKVRLSTEVKLPPNTTEISEGDLAWLRADVDAMQGYLAGNSLDLPRAMNDCEVGAKYGERHLWGPFNETDIGLQMHFWRVSGCFPTEATK